MRQVMLATHPRMIAVCMRDDGTIHGNPWIDVHICLRTIDALFGELKQGRRHGIRYSKKYTSVPVSSQLLTVIRRDSRGCGLVQMTSEITRLFSSSSPATHRAFRFHRSSPVHPFFYPF